MKVVLWDVDGTLLLNGGRAGRLYDDAIQDVTGFAPTGERPGEHGKTDAQIITERLVQYGLDPALRPEVTARLDVISVAGNSGEYARTVAPGVPAALDVAEELGWVNGLLTGNSEGRTRAKLAGAGLDLDRFDWTRGWFGDTAVRRSDIATAARESLGDAVAIVVGDTPSDVAAADVIGCGFLGVATGVFGEQELRDAGAEIVVPDLERGLETFRERLRRG